VNVTPSPRLAVFLSALQHVPDKEFVTPPGLGGGWRAKHVRYGLEHGVLNLHWSGVGLQFAALPKSHGACSECASKKSICTHCSCQACAFDRLTDEHGGPRVTRAQVERLQARLKAFQFAQGPRAPMLDDDL
jgi:hypothetical protein